MSLTCCWWRFTLWTDYIFSFWEPQHKDFCKLFIKADTVLLIAFQLNRVRLYLAAVFVILICCSWCLNLWCNSYTHCLINFCKGKIFYAMNCCGYCCDRGVSLLFIGLDVYLYTRQRSISWSWVWFLFYLFIFIFFIFGVTQSHMHIEGKQYFHSDKWLWSPRGDVWPFQSAH